MSPPLSPRAIALRGLMADFVAERLQAKLDALKKPEDEPERMALRAKYQVPLWLDDAARRSGQLQVVTHALKGTHPDAKGSSLRCEPGQMAALPEVGSQCLPLQAELDVVGNAAALDVYKFLKLRLTGEAGSLLSLALAADADWLAALSDDPAQAQAWSTAFAVMAQARGTPASHTLAKQVYWRLAGQDAHAADSYHLLAPLYPTALVHQVHVVLQAHRFSDEAKEARAARKAQAWHAEPTHDYPGIAFQKLGGTKPQNISQLNSERRGANPLLASLPPLWDENRPQPPLRVTNLFQRLRFWPGVRASLVELNAFLLADPERVLATRDAVKARVDALLDALIMFTAWARELPPGWSQQSDCQLPTAQRRWLDPEGATPYAGGDLHEQLATDFSLWLNDQLRRLSKGQLTVDADMARAWATRAADALRLHEPEEALHADSL